MSEAKGSIVYILGYKEPASEVTSFFAVDRDGRQIVPPGGGYQSLEKRLDYGKWRYTYEVPQRVFLKAKQYNKPSEHIFRLYQRPNKEYK